VLKYTLHKLLVAALVAVTVSFVAFMLLRLSGDLASAMSDEAAKGEDVARMRTQLGLDRPLVTQYWDWASSAASGDFGKSFYYPEAVWTLLAQRLPVTLTLACWGLVVSLAIGIPLGVLAALRPNTLIDRIAMTLAVLGQALPAFWLGLLLIIFFGLTLGWLPISGADTWLHFVLPCLVLGYASTPAVMRLTRSGMLEVLASDYIRTAYAKGLPHRTVLFKHALRNAVIPVVALASVQFGHMLSGSVVIETVFAMEGIGQLAWQSISRQDFPVVQAVLLLVSMFYVWLTFASDLINAWLDPRIRAA
jgi:ABC-type dipeptide/oligopeptide/nickel transport system permease component